MGKKKQGNILMKMLSKLPESMLSKLLLKYILRSKVDFSDEIYQRDFRNFSLRVNWDICGFKGYQTFDQKNYSYKYGQTLEEADVTITIDKMDLIVKGLGGENLEAGLDRDSENNLIITNRKGFEIMETEYGPRRTPIKETILTSVLRDPDNVHPLVITKIPMLRVLIPERDNEVEGEEYGAYIPINQSLGTFDSQILPYKVFEHFIEKASNIVIHKCMCRHYYKCKNHPIELGCMYLGDDTMNMIIPSDRGRVATKEEALERVKLAIESGLIPLMGRDMGEIEAYGVKDTGHVLSTCFCCSCCCIHGKVLTYGTAALTSEFLNKMNGLEVKVDDSKCVGCGNCLDVCVFKGREVLKGKAHIEPEYCLGCGRCVDVCPEGAISISIEDPSYVDGLIKKIESLVDVTSQ
ncbi:MAG: 4Fe-4S dicluster domain-containing protein [archaeon]|nr:4Fe-4S dicluster domain-containing protein [archaeon]